MHTHIECEGREDGGVRMGGRREKERGTEGEKSSFKILSQEGPIQFYIDTLGSATSYDKPQQEIVQLGTIFGLDYVHHCYPL